MFRLFWISSSRLPHFSLLTFSFYVCIEAFFVLVCSLRVRYSGKKEDTKKITTTTTCIHQLWKITGKINNFASTEMEFTEKNRVCSAKTETHPQFCCCCCCAPRATCYAIKYSGANNHWNKCWTYLFIRQINARNKERKKIHAARSYRERTNYKGKHQPNGHFIGFLLHGACIRMHL